MAYMYSKNLRKEISSKFLFIEFTVVNHPIKSPETTFSRNIRDTVYADFFFFFFFFFFFIPACCLCMALILCMLGKNSRFTF